MVRDSLVGARLRRGSIGHGRCPVLIYRENKDMQLPDMQI